MEYKVTFETMPGLTVILLVLSVASFFTGFKLNEPFLLIVGMGLIFYLFLLRLRLKVVLQKDAIEYTGLFRTKTIRFDDVIAVSWMSAYGFQDNKYRGPATYQIRSENSLILINFRLFPMTCMRDVLAAIERLNLDAKKI